jgi:hypothetical protein
VYPGGGGGFALKIITGLTPGTSVTITIGDGGGPYNPGTGGTSSFGTYVSATGGKNAASGGTPGGVGSGGDINMYGQGGMTSQQYGGNAGNLFIVYSGASNETYVSQYGAITLMAIPENGLDKIGTGYLFGIPSTTNIFEGVNQNSITSLPPTPALNFGNGVGGSTYYSGGTYASPGSFPAGGGGGSTSSTSAGGGGLVVVEY